MDKKIIFLGGVWGKEEEDKIIRNSNGNVQIAANVLQTNLIEGLDKKSDHNVVVLNELFIGAYPKRYKKALIVASKFDHDKSGVPKDYNIEFLNLPLIKHYSRYFHSKKYIRNICKKYSKSELFFVGYSMSYSIVKGLLYAKRICPKRVRTCLIIPDLPEYMNLGKNKGFVFNLLKSISSKQLYREIKSVDSFVPLTKYIYESLNVNKPYTVVEGVASVADGVDHENSIEKPITKKIVYTGTLEIKYGIGELVDAFRAIKNEDLRLVICGAGDGEDYIKSAMKYDARIVFKGIVDNKTARNIQETAYLLVNPRNSNEEYTKYSFPSKTMEYMSSGRPVLMYKLKGIPDEYDDYLFYVNKNIETSIRNILNLDEKYLADMGKKARTFVLEQKNKYKQAEKIFNLLESLS